MLLLGTEFVTKALATSTFSFTYFQNWLILTAHRWWHPTPVLLPGKSHGRRSLVGCSPWGRWGLDTTERLHFNFSLSCIGEGNGNPLQCSCLENPRDGGGWWAAVYGVAQSRTRLKRLSSSGGSSSSRSSASISKGLQTVRKDHICHRETLLLHLAKANKRFLF